MESLLRLLNIGQEQITPGLGGLGAGLRETVELSVKHSVQTGPRAS